MTFVMILKSGVMFITIFYLVRFLFTKSKIENLASYKLFIFLDGSQCHIRVGFAAFPRDSWEKLMYFTLFDV